ncbi:proprotein convertase P-domain-containing protein [Kribbella sp. CA-253562]|uniref:proprotein convertase P-domain-containing protein n=1 Tax=Kribbella sp. CA-253562 TaxID=3239942 RepID=UPI003D944501
MLVGHDPYAVAEPAQRAVRAPGFDDDLVGPDVNPGDPWWPGSETDCSVGFPATDAQGNKHFLTAGHCTNDANQPAYGEVGQRNRLGTSNVGGARSVNAREGDMGVVATTETGSTISPAVNTWGQPALTVTGSAEAIVGDTVCHSGNTTCLEDLNISLVSPSGRWSYLQRYGGSSCHALPSSKTYSVPAAENATGTWTLRIGDNGPGDSGTLTNWSITR